MNLISKSRSVDCRDIYNGSTNNFLYIIRGPFYDENSALPTNIFSPFVDMWGDETIHAHNSLFIPPLLFKYIFVKKCCCTKWQFFSLFLTWITKDFDANKLPRGVIMSLAYWRRARSVDNGPSWAFEKWRQSLINTRLVWVPAVKPKPVSFSEWLSSFHSELTVHRKVDNPHHCYSSSPTYCLFPAMAIILFLLWLTHLPKISRPPDW